MIGTYTSVNDMPIFADYVAAHGPFDPDTTVTLVINDQGQYTPNGELTNYFESGSTQALAGFYNDATAVGDQNGQCGVYALDGNGVIYVDFNSTRYILMITQMQPDARNIIYSILLYTGDGGVSIHQQAITFPGDHPFLMCTKPDVLVQVKPADTTTTTTTGDGTTTS